MAYQLLHLESGKYYESQNVRFNEKLVYGDKYGPNLIILWPEEEYLDPEEEQRWFSDPVGEEEKEDCAQEDGEKP